MKKLFTICLAIIFATQLFAQNSNKKNFKSLKEKMFLIQKHQNRHANNMMSKSAFKEKLDSTITEVFDGADWIKDSYETYEIDANGVIISSTSSYWNDIDMRFNQSKTEYTYTNGKTSLETNYYYEYVSMDWKKSSKTEYEYNTDGNEIKNTQYSWNPNNSTWLQSSKIETEYDANKNEIKSTYYYWANSWLEYSKEENNYNGSNQKIKTTSYSWDSNASDWYETSISNMTYNSNGNISLSVNQSYDENTHTWSDDYKQSFNYDANQNITSGIFEAWDDANQKWVEQEKVEITYDLNVAFSDIIYPNDNFGELNLVNKILGLNYFEKDNNDWALTSKEAYYYSPFTTSGINKNNVITNVYPNPAKDIVNFKSPKMESASEILVFDINGKQIAKYNVTGNNSAINISQLSTGFYMYKIVGADFISSGKLVKE